MVLVEEGRVTAVVAVVPVDEEADESKSTPTGEAKMSQLLSPEG